MKKTTLLFIMGLIITACGSSSGRAESYLGYQACAPCHNGHTAPDLKGRFSSADELIRTAKSVKNPMMSNVQQNDALLRAAAKDLGLK
ncbi:MAG TPA: hypothetical protein VK448_08190 [Dissulfurispiraceae bacterium]|nr:hypothetical protein [Dissulfurispiraceae bacterium]